MRIVTLNGAIMCPGVEGGEVIGDYLFRDGKPEFMRTLQSGDVVQVLDTKADTREVYEFLDQGLVREDR